MVFQSYHLLDDLTVQENIDLPLSYKDIPRSERQSLVADTLDRFQIVAKKDLYPSQLSGGQQQLVGIARAVIHKPPLAARRRADRQSAFRPGQGDHGTLSRIESTGNDHRAGHSLGSECGLRKPHHPVARRLAGRRYSESGTQPTNGGQRIVRFHGFWFLATRNSPSFACMGRWSAASGRKLQHLPRRRVQPRPRRPRHFALRCQNRAIHLTPTCLRPCRNPHWRIPRVFDQLIRDGKLYLSLKDAIDLALENNLDLAIARYNLPIADTDILRTQAGGIFRGVNTGVVQGTPGGGVGGFGTGAPGAGAGGTTSGAGGAGAGASGLVQSTLGAGTPVSSYDPAVHCLWRIEHQTIAAGEPADLRSAFAPIEYRSGQRSVICRRFQPAPAFLSSSAIVARLPTALFFFCRRH